MTIVLTLLLLFNHVATGQVNQANAAAVHRRVFSGATPGAITAAMTRGDKDIVVDDLPVDVNYMRAETPESQARMMGCAPGMTVLVAAVRFGNAFPTEDMGALYSEWTVEIVEVLRASPDTDLRAGALTTVLHSGGRTMINGRRVTSGRYARTMMESGRRYLIFAWGQVPATKALVTDLHGFDLTGSPKPLSDYPFALKPGLASAELVSFVRGARRGCVTGPSGRSY
jgi:hypothetical protein